MVRIPACHAGGRGFESVHSANFWKTDLALRASKRVKFLRAVSQTCTPQILSEILHVADHTRSHAGIDCRIIIGLVCLTFALWGVESYINQARQIIVAEVNGDEIPVEEFQTSLQRLRRQAENMLGDQFNAEEWNQPDVKMRALDSLINDRILASLIKMHASASVSSRWYASCSRSRHSSRMASSRVRSMSSAFRAWAIHRSVSNDSWVPI